MTDLGDDRRDEFDETSRLRRRTLLGGLALGGAAAAGASYAVTQRDPGPVPEEHDWEPADPPLATPWFDDVSAQDPHDKYPRPQLVRNRWRHLNGVWGFETASASDEPPIQRSLNSGILVPFPVESALSGVADRIDRMWYRRTFEIPDGWDVRGEERLLLHFEAVDYETTVYVNGQRIGNHTGGYGHFAFDITDALSDARRQEIVVGVIDETEEGQVLGKQHPNEGNIWYTPTSGIWQSVWLEPVSPVHITGLDMTPDLENDQLALTVETTVGDGLTVAAKASSDDEIVATDIGAQKEELSLSIPEPNYWSPSDPFLYDLNVELRRDRKVIDSVASYFGMRSVETERRGGRLRMLLNGEVSFALATLDQGYWPEGIYTAPTDEALVADLESHHELGFNAVRKHVKIEPRRWYYHADRLGLVVHQDMPSTADFSGGPDEAQRAQFEKELLEMVTQLGNHPSITVWVPFNEGWGSFDTERITSSVAELDSERLVNANSGANIQGGDCECGDILDFHNYPGPGSAPMTEDRLVVLGEFGGMGLAIDDHRWGSEGFSYDTYLTSAGLTDAYIEKLARTRLLATHCELSSAVYTQLTDVETENNGLLTYDRRKVKIDPDRVRMANHALLTAATTPNEWPTASNGSIVAHWPLDELDNDTVNDAVGDADAQVLGSPSSTEGYVGGALAFDGDAVETQDGVINTLESYSVAAWVRIRDPSQTSVAVSQDGDAVSAFALQYDSGTERFAFTVAESDAPGNTVHVRATEPVEPNQWYHLVGVRDAVAGTVKLYVNGALADDAAFCPGFEATGATVIGRGKQDGIATSYWRGSVDEVRLFDRALGDDEAAAAYDLSE